jgi:hypothetical protein
MTDYNTIEEGSSGLLNGSSLDIIEALDTLCHVVPVIHIYDKLLELSRIIPMDKSPPK